MKHKRHKKLRRAPAPKPDTANVDATSHEDKIRMDWKERRQKLLKSRQSSEDLAKLATERSAISARKRNKQRPSAEVVQRAKKKKDALKKSRSGQLFAVPRSRLAIGDGKIDRKAVKIGRRHASKKYVPPEFSRGMCESACGLDANRRDKPLNLLDRKGSTDGADSQACPNAANPAIHKEPALTCLGLMLR